jgi:hypothetical protein
MPAQLGDDDSLLCHLVNHSVFVIDAAQRKSRTPTEIEDTHSRREIAEIEDTHGNRATEIEDTHSRREIEDTH